MIVSVSRGGRWIFQNSFLFEKRAFFERRSFLDEKLFDEFRTVDDAKFSVKDSKRGDFSLFLVHLLVKSDRIAQTVKKAVETQSFETQFLGADRK